MPRYRTHQRRYGAQRKKRESNGGVRKRIGSVWKLIKMAAVLLVIAVIAASYYMGRLDRVIAEKFDQERKWNLPSRVFSDAEYLYPGIDIDKRHLIAKLDRLGYRDVGSALAGPGDYALTPDHLDISLHDFDYPEGPFKGFPVRLELSPDQ